MRPILKGERPKWGHTKMNSARYSYVDSQIDKLSLFLDDLLMKEGMHTSGDKNVFVKWGKRLLRGGTPLHTIQDMFTDLYEASLE
jgi:hypothetical protein